MSETAAALAVFTAGPGAVTASSLRGAVTDSEDLDLALEYATNMYPKVDVYSDYDFDPEDEEEDADLDLDLYDEDGEDMDLISYYNRRTNTITVEVAAEVAEVADNPLIIHVKLHPDLSTLVAFSTPNGALLEFL
ncbi:hypothetical protein ACHAWC_008392 [Mediolabrus comicus]